MSNEYELVLQGLRKLKAQGEDGFEGLVRDLLEVLCGRSTLRLVKSGPQSGKDVMSEGGAFSTGIAIEAKKFEEKTSLPLDELKSKLRDALDTSPTMDVWGVALSKEMKEPDWSELVRIIVTDHVQLLDDWFTEAIAEAGVTVSPWFPRPGCDRKVSGGFRQEL